MTWPDLAAVQQPPWPDAPEVERAVAQLRALPPLVFAGECDLLTERLAQASRGEAFVLTLWVFGWTDTAQTRARWWTS